MQDSLNISPLPEEEANTVKALLKKVLPGSSNVFIESHLKIVAAIRKLGSASMNDLAKLLNARPNYIHVRLKNLAAAQTLGREKVSRGVSATGRKLTEFVYSLRDYPSPDSLESEHTDNSSATAIASQPMQPKPKRSIPDFNVAFKSRTLPHELPKLPDFDPSWPVEIQVEWLKTYQQLLDVRAQEIKRGLS